MKTHEDPFADRYANIIFNQIKEEERIADIIKTNYDTQKTQKKTQNQVH
jgi:hypothetical protein